jgi:hypothetical protein
MRNDRFLAGVRASNLGLLVEGKDPAAKFQLTGYKLTALGDQLAQLAKYAADEEYLRAVGNDLKAHGFTVSLGRAVSLSGSQFNVVDARLL